MLNNAALSRETLARAVEQSVDCVKLLSLSLSLSLRLHLVDEPQWSMRKGGRRF